MTAGSRRTLFSRAAWMWVAMVGIMIASTTTWAQSNPSNWPQYGGDPQHTFYSSTTASFAKTKLSWESQPNYYGDGAFIENGTVFMANNYYKYISAANLSNGEVLWTNQMEVDRGPLTVSVGQEVYYRSVHTLYGLDPKTGSVKFSQALNQTGFQDSNFLTPCVTAPDDESQGLWVASDDRPDYCTAGFKSNGDLMFSLKTPYNYTKKVSLWTPCYDGRDKLMWYVEGVFRTANAWTGAVLKSYVIQQGWSEYQQSAGGAVTYDMTRELAFFPSFPLSERGQGHSRDKWSYIAFDVKKFEPIWFINCSKGEGPLRTFFPQPAIDPVQGTVFFNCNSSLLELDQRSGELLNKYPKQEDAFIITPQEVIMVNPQTVSVLSRSNGTVLNTFDQQCTLPAISDQLLVLPCYTTFAQRLYVYESLG